MDGAGEGVKGGEHAVAGALEDASGVGGDGGVDEGVVPGEGQAHRLRA